ncbi:hypothetical protein BVX94_02745, partial [bacterium B17]
MRKTSSTLIVVVLALLSVGIVILASTSSVRGASNYGDAYFFVRRQLMWLAIAFVVGFFASRFDYHNWKRYVVPLSCLALFALVLV